MALMGVGGAAHIFRHWDLAFCQRQGSQDDSDGGEYGRGWTNPYRLRSALVVGTPSFAVGGRVRLPPPLFLGWGGS